MGEGGGFPQVQAMVSLANPELPVACPNIKGAPECELTNLLVSLMQVRISNKACHSSWSHPGASTCPSTLSSVKS